MNIRCVSCGKEVPRTSLNCCGVQYAMNGTYTIPAPKLPTPLVPRASGAMPHSNPVFLNPTLATG